MFAKGFRPRAGQGQHKVAVQFAEMTLGEKFQDEIHIFDKMVTEPFPMKRELKDITRHSIHINFCVTEPFPMKRELKEFLS